MSKHTKARKPLLKLNLRKPCLQPEKGFSFEVFFSFAKRPSVRKFPATIRTASKKKTTDSVIPPTCEGTEYCKDEDDVLFELEPGDTFLIFFMK